MTKIKAGVLGNTKIFKKSTRSLIPAYECSLAQLFKNINPVDKHFLKYVPSQFLSAAQKAAKARKEVICDIIGEVVADEANFDYSSVNSELRPILEALDKVADRIRSLENGQEIEVRGGGETQNKIITLADGRKYVKADRQVIHGTDSGKWGAQVANYINRRIRNGKNVGKIKEAVHPYMAQRPTRVTTSADEFITASDDTKITQNDPGVNTYSMQKGEKIPKRRDKVSYPWQPTRWTKPSWRQRVPLPRRNGVLTLPMHGKTNMIITI